jgi:hypothetical protein
MVIKQRGFEDKIKLLTYRDLHNERVVDAQDKAAKLQRDAAIGIATQELLADPAFQAKLRNPATAAQAVAELQGKMSGLSDQAAFNISQKLDNTPQGKAYNQADVAVGDINSVYEGTIYDNDAQRATLDEKDHNQVAGAQNGSVHGYAGRRDILTNPDAQLALIDRYAFLETGSTRPPLAQYKKILEAASIQDYADIMKNLLAHHAILGRDQINNIVRVANEEYRQRRRTFVQFLMRPDYIVYATGITHKLPPLDKIQQLQEGARKPPSGYTAAQVIQSFDYTYGSYGPHIAEDILGVPDQ